MRLEVLRPENTAEFSGRKRCKERFFCHGGQARLNKNTPPGGKLPLRNKKGGGVVPSKPS